MDRLDLMSVFSFMSWLWFNCRFFISSWLVCSLWLVLIFGNHLVLCWLDMLCWFMLYLFVLGWFMLSGLVLNFIFNLMLHFGLLLMFYFMLDFFLNLMLRFMLFYLMLNFMLCWLMLNCSLWFALFFSLFSSLLLFGISLKFSIFLRSLLKLLWNISYCSPILSMLLLLPAHLDKKPPGKNFLIKAAPDEVDGINFALEDNFKRSRVVLLNFDELEVRKCFFDILLHCLEIAFDEIEWDMFNLIAQSFDLLN